MSKLPCSGLLPIRCPDSMPQHVFNKDSIAALTVLDKDVGDCADDFPVLDDRAAGQEHVNTGVKDFSRFLKKMISICRKQYIFDHF